MAPHNYVYEYRVRRVRRSCAADVSYMSCPATAAAVFRTFTKTEPRELFLVASVDGRNACLGIEVVAIGTAAGVEVHPREVFRAAILAGASAVVVAHNHPSNNASPSQQDYELTTRLVEVGDLVGIPVLDHVIVTDDEHTSIFAALGRFPNT